jgi:BspA type Leucine rich repeat region (6 copies)/Immunoglobulin domain
MKRKLNAETGRRHSSTSLPPLGTTNTAAANSKATRFRRRTGPTPFAWLALLALTLTVPVREASAQGSPPYYPPTVETLPATEVFSSSATLNGTVQPNDGGLIWFDWGTSTNYGNSTSETGIGSGTNVVPFSALLPWLTPNTTYHFRAAAMRAGLYNYGRDQSFTTLPSPLQPQFTFTTNNGTITITGYTGAGGAVTIPSTINGYPVSIIGDNAFEFCSRLTSVMIPNSVTSIAEYAFYGCASLTSVMIGNGVTNIGNYAFHNCTSLTSVTIGNGVTTIGNFAFYNCYSLTGVTIGNGITSIGDGTFSACSSLRGAYFMGNAPWIGSDVFDDGGPFHFYDPTTVYYLPGTTGWGSTFGGRPTALWIQVPTIQTSPQTQTAEAGSPVSLRMKAGSPLPLFYFWYLNATNLVSSGTNWQLDLPNVRFSQSGPYTVVISNVLGAVTTSPAMLQVIPAVERTPVPGVKVTGQTGNLLNVDYAESLSPAPNWTALGSVSLTSTSGYCFDVTLPLPSQRFYRAWQTTPRSLPPTLDFHLVPAITLTGSVASSVRLDFINRFGPIDAWVTLDTVTLTNTSQLYFDVSAPGQPERLYRLVPVP